MKLTYFRDGKKGFANPTAVASRTTMVPGKFFVYLFILKLYMLYILHIK